MNRLNALNRNRSDRSESCQPEDTQDVTDRTLPLNLRTNRTVTPKRPDFMNWTDVQETPEGNYFREGTPTPASAVRVHPNGRNERILRQGSNLPQPPARPLNVSTTPKFSLIHFKELITFTRTPLQQFLFDASQSHEQPRIHAAIRVLHHQLQDRLVATPTPS